MGILVRPHCILAPRGAGLARAFGAALWLLLLAFGSACLAQEAVQRRPEAVLLEIRGAIGPAVTDYLQQGFQEAAERRAELILIRMDTPGGLDSSTRDIIRDILASPIPVVTYVAPSGARAASAGTYILYASHLAAMAPGTNLGAATPVQIGGGAQPLGGPGEAGDAEELRGPGDALRSKVINDSAAFMRGLAELHGRNKVWAEAAVRQAASLEAGEALDKGVIEIVANDLDALMRQADGRIVRVRQEPLRLDTTGISVTPIEPGWRHRLLAIITDPNVAYILLLVGIYGIILEFFNPGIIFSGVIGAICLVIGLFALNLLPINYAGIGLIVLGAALMSAEAFAPSFGILGIGGIVAFATGSFLLFDAELPEFSLSWPVILAATGVTSTFVLAAGMVAVRAHRRRVTTGEAEMIGSVAEVLGWSGQIGQVRAHGERWQARSSEPLAPGQRVRIVGREKLTLLVERDPHSHDGEAA